jgi:hypothetical protein
MLGEEVLVRERVLLELSQRGQKQSNFFNLLQEQAFLPSTSAQV